MVFMLAFFTTIVQCVTFFWQWCIAFCEGCTFWSSEFVFIVFVAV